MNSDVIRLLPDSVANQIAAGEVIQRPASVIKELVENSVDAGARHITINIKDGGRTLIQVIDDGCGMSPRDARMAFERHATSKITSADDLFSLHTMGFRGEALPSIAAVAQIELRTKRHDDSVGTCLLISQSQFDGQEPCACASGTNLMVKNIFYALPGRRRFLKKDSIELGHILREFERLALVNTDIDFTLIHNDVTMHQFPAASFKQRICDLFGKNLEGQISSIGTETSLIRISGFIGMPRFAKKRGAQQFLFVNGRHMRHPLFHKAILKSYENLIPADSQPSYFISFEVDPAAIDVNIHPQKHEIKFENEQAIWQILSAAVRETLGKTQAAGALDFDSDDATDIPLFRPDTTAAMPPTGASTDFNPFRASAGNSGGIHRPPTSVRDWDQLFDSFTRDRNQTGTVSTPQPDSLDFGDDLLRASSGNGSERTPSATSATGGYIQLHAEYIIGSAPHGLMIISQHRAHVRVLFDRFFKEISRGEVVAQQLFFPESIGLSASETATMPGRVSLLRQLGFEVINAGNNVWQLTAAPGLLGNANPREVLRKILDELEELNTTDVEIYSRPVALSMARSAAIRTGQTLSPAEMDALVADLFRSSDPAFTPDGLTILNTVRNEDIANLFK